MGIGNTDDTEKDRILHRFILLGFSQSTQRTQLEFTIYDFRFTIGDFRFTIWDLGTQMTQKRTGFYTDLLFYVSHRAHRELREDL